MKMLLCQINHAIMVFPWGWIAAKGICNGGLEGMCLHRLPSESLCHPAVATSPCPGQLPHSGRCWGRNEGGQDFRGHRPYRCCPGRHCPLSPLRYAGSCLGSERVAGLSSSKKVSPLTLPPVLLLLAVMEGWGGGGTEVQRGKAGDEISQELGTVPGLFHLRNYSSKINTQRGYSQQCLHNPNFWWKDLFQKARLILGLK